MSESAQYDSIRNSYAELASVEPSKQFVQYPEILRLLGDVKNKKILDVGCGPGLLTRQLARKGATLVAYDNSVEQINIAKAAEAQMPLGINYFVADAGNIEKVLREEIGNPEKQFDSAISTLVLHYAEDVAHLEQFFSSTGNMLKDGGRFVTILCNPDYKKLGEAAYNRVFRRTAGKMSADFLDAAGNIKFSVTYSDFSRADYERSAKKAGFTRIEWLNLKIIPEGLEKMGQEFWKGFEEDCPYVGFIAYK